MVIIKIKSHKMHSDTSASSILSKKNHVKRNLIELDMVIKEYIIPKVFGAMGRLEEKYAK